ncbi:MAG: class I SAM-dependent methyltransferase [Alphaproteobacteria bacterium]
MHDNLNQIISNIIDADGSMNLGEFISTALCHPEYGYYMKGAPFGAGGDFVTAPEISQMFGEVIGAWVIDIWFQMGKPETLNLIECGPGRGTLMSDIMRVGKSVDGFVDAINIQLVEASGSLQVMQKDALKDYVVSWHSEISEINKGAPSILIGNEFLDALPIEQLMRNENGWQKRVIVLDENNGFKFTWAEADHKLKQLLPSETVSNKIYEVSPARNLFMSSCIDLLSASKGVALFIDYGYIKSHHGDTLQAVRKHEYTNVLEDIGLSDITSHIDFEALSRHVCELGGHVSPIQTQGNFLKALGIEQRLIALKNTAMKTNDTGMAANIIKGMDASVDRLIGNDQMGELFKVICVKNSEDITPAGF